ncbi:MAG: hypothetical protein P4M13_08720 [Alphaproteobacteria bacterium]|nr:hypothetical protein [Alphaproteobacteria bacterium]
MSSSISSATQQPQYFQATQASTKAGATSTKAATASLTAQQTNTTPTAAVAVESKATKNPNGTYGPKDTLLPPGVYKKGGVSETSASSQSPQATAETGVDVKI